MKGNVLLNFLLIGAIAVVVWMYSASQGQQVQAKRPDYENPTAPSQELGLLPGKQSELAEVIDVPDGDTLTVKQDWQTVKVQLCGIDAPELSQPLGVESRDKLRSLIPANKQVTLYVSDTDRYGRKVAEVFIPDPTTQQPEQEKLLNYELVRVGMAYRYPQYADRCPNGGVLAEAEDFARSKRLGVWADPKAVKPWDYRRKNR